MVPCRGPKSRRAFLRAGSFALGGLSLADVLAHRARGEVPSKRSAILLFLHGGPSQLETFDPKPDAPVDQRSVFRPMATCVPGMDICEPLPRLAAVADRFSLVRSLHHTMSSHSDGQIEVMTGKTPSRPDPTSTSKSDHPDIGMITSFHRGSAGTPLARYVAVPQALYATRPTYLGLGYQPLVVSDPAASTYQPPILAVGREGAEFEDRRLLLGQLDRLRRDLDSAGRLNALDRFREQALRMLSSRQAADAFDIGKEEPRLRDRYGRHRWGQSCLLARRLAEAGTAVVTVFVDTPANSPEFTNWDDHPGNAGRPGHFAEFMERRLPYLDQSLAALIADIFDRGLDREILVVVVGEFGRTPTLRRGPPDGSIGRDHWPAAYSALIAGGGLNMGQVVGQTDAKGAYPKDRPLSPQDLLATVYRHLGIDPLATIDDYFGRPVHVLPHGTPIRELL